jgi:hypothetical protein
VVICAYTPEMIVAEKLRAICQQMKEYEAIVPRPSRSPRARDFFDLCTLIEICGVDVRTAEFARLLRGSFAAKRVPLRFLSLLPDYRAFHEPDFVSVERTVKPGIRLQGFDHYFDRVLQVTNLLEPLWVEEPPLR